MGIVILLSYHQLTSLKKSLKAQVRLLVTINKQLRKRSVVQSRGFGRETMVQDSRSRRARPFSQHSHHTQYVDQVSNSPFHPRNNTPASSGSFSSHASLSLSGLPSVSSFVPSASEDVPNSELSASRVTTIHPLSGRSFHREEMIEREWQMRAPIQLVHGDVNRRDNSTQHNSNRPGQVSLHGGPSITSYTRIEPSAVIPPKEYWL